MTPTFKKLPSFAVTYITRGSDVLIEKAERIAYKLDCPLLDRNRNTIQSLLEQFNLDALIVVEQHGLTIRTLHGLLRYHPNTSVLRITNLFRGRNDVLTDLMQLKKGDRLLDCTCGLGSDAITGAYITGTEGYVLALESSPILALLAQDGMASYQHHNHEEVTQAMRHVKVKNTRYQDELRELPDNSFDVVYFDPMFKNSISKANGIELVRLWANYEVPTLEDIIHAKRIANRSVLLKDSNNNKLLNLFDFNIVKAGRHFSYGIIRCEH